MVSPSNQMHNIICYAKIPEILMNYFHIKQKALKREAQIMRSDIHVYRHVESLP